MQPEEEESTAQSYNTSSDKKHDAHGDENGEANSHVMGLLNSNYDHHADDIQAPSEVAPPSGHHAYPKSDGPLTVRKHDNIAEGHHNDYHKGAKGDHPSYKGRNYETSHADHHAEHGTGNDHYHHGHYAGHHGHGNGNSHGHGHHDYSNYYHSGNLDSFNDAVNMWQARSAHQQDPSSFLPYGRYALPTHHHDTHKDGLHHDYEDHGDNSVGYLLKSFMDIQSNHYHQPIRKSSFVSYTGNGFRKESFDFI